MSFSPNLDPGLIILITMATTFFIAFIIISRESLPSWDLEDLSFVMLVSIFLFFAAYSILVLALANNYPELVLINKEQIKENVQMLPNEHVTTGQYTFCIDGKLQKTETTDSTRYIQDSKDKPYIIVDKVTYNAPHRWYVDQGEIQEKNKEVDYKLKEVHY